MERDGFVILVDPSNGHLRTFGQAGLMTGEGIGMLVERGAGKAFVWHQHSVPATADDRGTGEAYKSTVEKVPSARRLWTAPTLR